MEEKDSESVSEKQKLHDRYQAAQRLKDEARQGYTGGGDSSDFIRYLNEVSRARERAKPGYWWRRIAYGLLILLWGLFLAFMGFRPHYREW